MCEELIHFVDWLYQNYSGALGLCQPYAAPLGDLVVAGVHFCRTSHIAGGVPVGMAIYGAGDRALIYCSLPIPCRAEGRKISAGNLAESHEGALAVDLPLAEELGLKTTCLDGNIALRGEIPCVDLYDRGFLFLTACGLLNKWARLGGDIIGEFKEILSRER